MKQMNSDEADRAARRSARTHRAHRAGARGLEALRDRVRRQARDDARHDDQRDAVADAAAGDLLAEPHQEHRTADQRDDRGDAEQQPGSTTTADVPALPPSLEPDGDEIALDRGQPDRAVARILVELLAPALALFLDAARLGDSDVASCTTIEAVM
jgi:hypothetical protein